MMDHLFVSYTYMNNIWCWIGNYNNFSFDNINQI